MNDSAREPAQPPTAGTTVRLRYAPLWWAGGWLLVAAVIYGSLQAPDGLPGMQVSDKLVHFGAYMSVTFWFSGLLQRRGLPLLALGMFALGGAIELAQGAMGLGRDADWRDIAANVLGIGSALVLAYAGLASWMASVERRLFGPPS